MDAAYAPLYVNDIKGHIPRLKVIWGQVASCFMSAFGSSGIYLSVGTILQSKPSSSSEKLHGHFTNTKHEKK